MERGKGRSLGLSLFEPFGINRAQPEYANRHLGLSAPKQSKIFCTHDWFRPDGSILAKPSLENFGESLRQLRIVVGRRARFFRNSDDWNPVLRMISRLSHAE